MQADPGKAQVGAGRPEQEWSQFKDCKLKNFKCRNLETRKNIEQHQSRHTRDALNTTEQICLKVLSHVKVVNNLMTSHRKSSV